MLRIHSDVETDNKPHTQLSYLEGKKTVGAKDGYAIISKHTSETGSWSESG
jgi:hypothetical protein